MAVYDDERQKTGTSDDELRKITGISPDEESAMDREAYNGAANDIESKSLSGGELAAAEAGGAKPESSKAEAAEQNDADETLGKGYKEEKQNWLIKSLGTRKGKMGAGIVVAATAGSIFIAGFMGPSLFINHLRELLLTRVSQLQVDHSLKYRRRYIHKVGDMFTRDGRRGAKIMDDMRRRGYDFRFDADGKMIGIIRPDGQGIPSFAIADHLNDYLELRHPLRTGRWKTKRMEAFYSRYKVTRTSVTVRAVDDPEDPERAVNKKTTQSLLGEEVSSRPTGGVGEQEGETDEQAADREARNDVNEGLATDSDVYDELKQKLLDGTPIEELSPEEQDLLKIGRELDPDLFNLANSLADGGSIASRAFTSFKSIFGSLDIIDRVCTVKNRLTAIQLAARTFRALNLLRYASVFVKAADATRSGNLSRVDPGMFNALMNNVTAVDRNGNALGASPGMAYILKGKFSRSGNDAFKGSFGVDGKLTGFPGAIQSATDGIPLSGGTSCGIVQNPLTQIGVAALEIGAAIFSGGGSAAATSTAKTAAINSFKQAMQRLVSRQMARTLARGVLTGIAVELTFEGMMAMTQLYAERSMAIPFTGQEVGGELGSALAGGAGVLNRQRSYGAGQIPATEQQFAQAQATFLAEKEQEKQSQSFFARYFDYSNQDSLAFQTVSTVAFSPAGTVGGSSTSNGLSLSNVARSIFSTPINSFGSIFTGKVSAQSEDEVSFDTIEVGGDTLATDPAGNPLTYMPEEIASIDPIVNRDELVASGDIDPNTFEPLSDSFVGHIEKCVNSVDTYSALEEGDRTVENDCLAKMELTRKYKAHLAYLDMLDTIDASLFPEEIVSTGGGTTSGSARIPPEGLVWPIIQTKADATSNLGNCLRSAEQSICHAGHPYLAHDLFAEPGTQVVAVAGGEVIKATNGTCGHGFGSAFSVQVYNAETDTTYFYQHLDPALGGVTRGATVNPGDPIGKIGSTSAACNTSPHLHIDAATGSGRPPCSRKSCTAENKSRFVDISGALFKGYEVLQ